MKTIIPLLLIASLFLVGCHNDNSFSTAEAEYGISGYVISTDSSYLVGISVYSWSEGKLIDSCRTDNNGFFYIGGSSSGHSFYWLTTQDYRHDTVPHYEGDSVRVVLDYKGGNGRSNLGNGTATVNLVMKWIIPENEP